MQGKPVSEYRAFRGISMKKMKIKKFSAKNYEVIKLIGEASSDEAFHLSKAFESLRNKNVIHIAVDTEETSFIDSTILGVLIYNWKILEKSGGNLSILKPSSYVQDILHNSKLSSILRIVESENEL